MMVRKERILQRFPFNGYARGVDNLGSAGSNVTFRTLEVG